MPGLTAEDLVAKYEVDNGIQSPGPPEPPAPSQETVASRPYATGDIVRVLGPKLPFTPKTAEDLVADYEAKQGGKPNTVKTPLVAPDLLAKASQAPPSAQDLVAKFERGDTFTVGADEPADAVTTVIGKGISTVQKGIDALLPGYRQEAQKTASAFASGAKKVLPEGMGHDILRVLGAAENGEVSLIKAGLGIKQPQDPMDNTYTNLFKELGAPDNLTTDAFGLGMSIITDPLTYMSFGTKAAYRISEKVALSAKGMTAAAETAKARTASSIASMAAKGLEITPETEARLARRSYEDVTKEISSRFGGGSIQVGQDVAALPKNIVDQGGMKFAGKTLITGKDVIDLAEASKVPQAIRAMKEAAVELPVVGPEIQAAGDYIGRELAIGKDMLGKMFIPKYGVERGLVDIWQKTNETARNIYRRDLQFWDGWFKRYGLDEAGKSDFNDSIRAAWGKGDLVGEVKSQTGDPKVQKAIDRWLGQGEFAGRRSMTDRLARYSKLIEGTEKPNWLPGIAQSHVQDILAMKVQEEGGPALREFNKARSGQNIEYVADPAKAIALRRTQAAMANIQDRIFEQIKAQKLGNPKNFNSLEEALAAGYVPLNKSSGFAIQKAFLENKAPVVDLSKPAQAYYVTKDFVDQYNQLAKVNLPQMPFLNHMVNLWKGYVTAPFPAFHFRNINSSIIQNAYNIGGHAINPVTNMRAMDMVLGRNLEKEFKTAIGEPLTLKKALTEMESEGMIGKGAFVADLGGETLDPEARAVWHTWLSRANPLSLGFAPIHFGRQIGNAIETQVRAVNYLTWRMKGLSPALAAREALEASYDYSAITNGERWAKLIIPFYTYSKKNLEYSARVFAQRPAVFSAQLKAIRDLGPTQEDWEGMKDWYRTKVIAKIKGTLVAGWGLPFEDLMESISHPIDKLMQMSNPLLRYPVENYFNQDFFSKRAITDLNSANEFRWVEDVLDNPKAPQPIRDIAAKIHNWLDLKEDKKNGVSTGKLVGNTDKLHMLRAFPTSRFQSFVGLMQKEDQDMYDVALRFLLGFVKIEPNPELEASNKGYEFLKQMADDINRNNLAKAKQPFVIVGGNPSAKAGLKAIREQAIQGIKTHNIDTINQAKERFDQLKEDQIDLNKE